MDHNMNSNSSKELLYSEYTGSSVIGHVMETLEKKTSKKTAEKIDMSFRKKEKSETFERVRKLMHLIETEQDEPKDLTKTSNEKTNVMENVENNEGIEVVMEVDENSPESNIDAWFLLKIPKEEKPKYSDDELEENSPSHKLLDFSDSSDTSDDESVQNFPIIVNGFALNNSHFSNSSSDEEVLNLSHSSETVKKSTKFFINHSPDSSKDNKLEQKFPVITKGFALNDLDSSNSSSHKSESNCCQSLKMQNSPNFVSDNSSNSSDIKNGQYLSVSYAKENLNCVSNNVFNLPIPLLKKNRKIIEISDNESSDDLKRKVGKHSSPSSAQNCSSETKSNFVLNDSSTYSYDDCKQNCFHHNGQKYLVEDNCLDTSGVMEDVSGLGREETSVLGPSKLADNDSAECQSDLKRRKLCVVKDEIPNNCDSKSHKKMSFR